MANLDERQLVIIAGGKGSRLRSVTKQLPKALVLLAGVPVIERQIHLAVKYEFRDIVICTGFGGELIQARIGNGSRWGAKIRFYREEHPLGTAGALVSALLVLRSEFVVLYGDTAIEMDLERLLKYHRHGEQLATVVVHPNDHPEDSDLVELDGEDMVVAVRTRPHPPKHSFRNLAAAAVFVLDRRILLQLGRELRQPDLVRDVLIPRCSAREVRGYRSPEFIKDVGTPDRYASVCEQFERGIPYLTSLSRPQRAVFLDRDGTLNREVGGVRKISQLELLPGVATAVRRLNENGFRAVIVTNQPGIARGDLGESELEAIHARLEYLLGIQGAFVDRIYYCPHHPDSGFSGERAELKRRCECRKPAPGMLRRATSELNIDASKSFMVGDSWVDIMAAHECGIAGILISSSSSEAILDASNVPYRRAAALSDAVGWIIDEQATPSGE